MALAMEPRRGKGGIPAILSAAMDKLDGYLHDPSFLPTLNASNRSARQQRLERRVACVRILKAHLKYCDRRSLRVGIPQTDGTVKNLTLAFLARHAGLPLRRAERAMHDLRAAGLVTVRQQVEHVNEADGGGYYKGLAAMRFIHPALFSLLKLRKWLAREQQKASLHARLDRKRKPKGDGRGAIPGLILAGLSNFAPKRAQQRRATGASHSPATLGPEASQRLQARMVQLYEQHPERGRDWALAHAWAEQTPHSC